MAKYPPTLLTQPQGADIEIIERSQDSSSAIYPNAVRINGSEILIPANTAIKISEITGDSLVTVTVTMFVRSLAILREPPDTPPS